MIQFQEYLSSDYPGFASFIETIIKPIFGSAFRPDADLQDMIDYPEDIEDFNLITSSHDEDFRKLAAESNVIRLLKLGRVNTSNGIPIHVYDITVGSRKHIGRNRKGIQEIIRRNSEMTNQTGAFMLFHYADETWEWRFSYCFIGKNREDSTSAKRYTYLLGRGQSCKTAALRFQTLFRKSGKIAIEDITDAFSVESVSKEFFDEYRSNYADIVCYVTGKRMVKVGGKWEEKQEHEPNEFIMQQFAQFADPEKAVRDYVKKLMGRLVFLQFIQKKGWLGVDAIPVALTEKEYKNAFFARGQKSRDIVGSVYALQQDGTYKIVFDKLKQLSDEDEEFLAGIVKGKPWGTGPKDFMRKIFEGCVSAGKNYFDDYLEPMFYTGLNKNRGENGFYPALHRRIPFLNGGLFEQLDNYEWENKNFNIPNSIFSNKEKKGRNEDGILDIFDR